MPTELDCILLLCLPLGELTEQTAISHAGILQCDASSVDEARSTSDALRYLVQRLEMIRPCPCMSDAVDEVR